MQTNLWTCALRDVHPSDARTSLVSVSHYLYLLAQLFVSNKLCAWRHDMPPPLSSPVDAPSPRAPPSRRNVAVVSTPNTFSRSPLHLPYALRPHWVKRPFDLESGVRVHLWCGLPLCHFWSS